MNKTILIVEDDYVDRMALERNIVKNEGHLALYADSFNHAVGILSKNDIDVIVTDYFLGDGVGVDFISKYPDIPIVIITGLNDLGLAVNAMKNGAYDFLVKDFDGAYIQMIPIACQQAINRKNQELFLSKLIQAVEQNPSLIVITDLHAKIEYANPKMLEITGFTMEELIGNYPKVFRSGNHSEDFYKNLWETIRAGKKWTGEFYNKTKSGDNFWELASIAPIKNKAGNITHFVKVGENITELKNAHEEKVRAEKLNSVVEMAGAVSHELNQPLQIILGYSEMLLNKAEENKSLEKPIQTIVKNIHSISEKIEKIKNITEYKTIKYLEKDQIIDIHTQPNNKI
ncbi:MAG: PAS domain S-box protein [Candidatus Cloacimonetes bacterium]|nr:PAS domain S-box protein [Candidatus Cloacimonadota bacterium]